MSHRDGTRRVLLVEERGALRNLIRKVLEDAGYRVTVAADREEVLRKVRDRALTVDLVVLGPARVRGPVRELADEVRRLDPDCRVVLVSGRDGTNLAREEPDWIRRISRPLKLSDLFEAVESLMGRSVVEGSHASPGDHANPRNLE